MRGLYRGLASPLLGGALETAVNYAVYRAVRRHLSGLSGDSAAPGGDEPPPLFGATVDALLAGGVAGVALSAVLGPTELVKCRVQAGGDAGVAAAARRIWAQDGARGFARGLGATLAREVPGNAIFFATYEGERTTCCPSACFGIFCACSHAWGSRSVAAPARRAALQRSAPAGAGGAATVLCGGLAGMTYWSVVLPIDTAKTRMQVAAPGSADDTGLLRQLRVVYAQRGLAEGLYAGVRPVMLRAFVANAVQWVAWEAASTRLHAM